MAHRALSAFAIFAVSSLLAACGGGSSGPPPFVPVVTPTPPSPGTIAIAPSSLAFGGAGAGAQSFTVSSSLGNIAAPVIDPIGCGNVATISPPSSATLPATYTVTPNGNGSCSLVVSVNHQAAALGITVGAGASTPVLSQSTNAITVFVGGTSGSVTVTSSVGQLTPDATACAGIAAIGGSGGDSPQTFTIAPLAQGSCTLAVVDGASSVLVPITVNANPNGANALFITPSTLEFSSPAASPLQANLTFSGNAGSVGINEDDCIGNTGKPKIAYLTLTGVPVGTPVSLPQNVTVTPYGSASGTCSIVFTSSVGATQAVLNVIVH